MKKSVLAIVIIAALTLASCSQYTCPTYGKSQAPKAKAVKETRI